MSDFGLKVVEHKKSQNAKREKNRIAQQKHRQKKKDSIKKMMTILQKVKLAAAENDIGQVQELVKTPTIVLPVELPPTSVPCQEQGSCLELEELFSVASDSSCPAEGVVSVEVETSALDESTVIRQDESPLPLPSSAFDVIGPGPQPFFQPPMDPFFWDMGSLLPPPFHMQYFDTQSALPLFPPMASTNHWQSYPAIMAGM